MTVAFHTPGYIDPRSFLTFGINSKPNTNVPIGFFGTGLKYAIAGLVRLGCEVNVWIGSDRYVFVKKKIDFRDKEFDVIMMEKYRGLFKKIRAQELPFTTELGKTWEMWQLYRELEANTRDEGGHTLGYDAKPDNLPNANHQESMIVVYDPTGRFDAEHATSDVIFLPKKSMEVLYAGESVTIYNRPSEHIYYRGMRVAKFPDDIKMSPLTYEITSYLELTEDRTLKYMFYAMDAITKAIISCKDEKTIRIVLDQVKMNETNKPGERVKSFEATLPFDNCSYDPSEEFKKVMQTKKATDLSYLSGTRLGGYWNSYSLRADEESHIVPTSDMSVVDLLTAIEKWTERYDGGIKSPEARDRALVSARRLILLAQAALKNHRYEDFTYDLESVEDGQAKEKDEESLGDEVSAGASPVADSHIEKGQFELESEVPF